MTLFFNNIYLFWFAIIEVISIIWEVWQLNNENCFQAPQVVIVICWKLGDVMYTSLYTSLPSLIVIGFRFCALQFFNFGNNFQEFSENCNVCSVMNVYHHHVCTNELHVLHPGENQHKLCKVPLKSCTLGKKSNVWERWCVYDMLLYHLLIRDNYYSCRYRREYVKQNKTKEKNYIFF